MSLKNLDLNARTIVRIDGQRSKMD
jgi:hypothetical protein